MLRHDTPAIADEGQVPPPSDVLQSLPSIHMPLLIMRDTSSKTLITQRLAHLHHLMKLFVTDAEKKGGKENSFTI